MSSFSADPIFDSPLAVALIALALIALLWIGPQFGRLTPARRWALAALRLGVIALAVVALVRPGLVRTVRTPRKSVLVLLFDASRSMQLPSGRGQSSRWEEQRDALARMQPALARLADEMDLRVYAYDRLPRRIDASGGALALPERPLGEQTDIGASLALALQAELGQRLAGVILLGDGAQTAFEPQVETQEAGRRLRDDFAAPLFAATFGPAGDAAQSRDVAIERLNEQYTVFVKNELVIKALVRVRGYVRRDLPVELVLEDAAGKKQVIGSRSIQAEEDGRQVEVQFTHTPTQEGRYRLTLSIPPQPGELVVKNNQLSAYLTVLEGGLRVLYLEGSRRFEQKFLRRALNASPDIELDDRIVDERAGRKWPIDLGDDLTSGKYDAFILGDLDAAALGPQNLRDLAQAVQKGRGLLMLGGRKSFGWGHYRGTPVGDLLPVTMDIIEGKDDLDEAARDPFFLAGPLAALPASQHAITRLAPAADNTSIWQQLPPLAWAHKFHSVKEAPGVRVLLQTSRGEPLLVSGEYGSGRVLAFGGESTWLWQMHGFEAAHKRFWRQAILWLVKREDLQQDEVWVRLDQRRFNPGSRVQVTAGAQTSTGDAIPGAEFETVIILPTGERQPLRLATQREQAQGSFEVTLPGDYAVETTASAGGQKLGTARAEFLVFDRDVELSNPAADPDLMAALVGWTRQDGGRVVAPEQLPGLIDELARRPKEYDVRQSKWRLASTAGDAWLFLLLFAGLLSGEWWLRKKWGLV